MLKQKPRNCLLFLFPLLSKLISKFINAFPQVHCECVIYLHLCDWHLYPDCQLSPLFLMSPVSILPIWLFSKKGCHSDTLKSININTCTLLKTHCWHSITLFTVLFKNPTWSVTCYSRLFFCLHCPLVLVAFSQISFFPCQTFFLY